ncbi:receptor-like protein 9DC3 [Aristolochia californica]|uniref:receptor-like protein 9DC3 n=1 Tax=Aristolochia californica TaxID=171875 RepID=UPI0035D5853A
MIDLSYNNKFTYPIPFLTNPVIYFDFSYSQFSSVIPPLLSIPPTLVNCGSLKVLDLKANHLSSNTSCLQTLDLSGNEFSGTLPSWIGVRLSSPRILQLRGITNFTAMRINRIINNTLDYGSNYYQEKKKLESNFIGLNGLNLSVNQFFGKLPQSIGRLLKLINLNFSSIILGNQLDTLNDESIYVGNEGLCGYPLRKECKSDERDQILVQPFGDEEFEDVSKMRWIYVGITHGFAVLENYVFSICKWFARLDSLKIDIILSGWFEIKWIYDGIAPGFAFGFMVSKIGFVGNRHNCQSSKNVHGIWLFFFSL